MNATLRNTSQPATTKTWRATLIAVAALFLLAGCSIRQMAVDMMADTLGDSGSVYAIDDDPALVREALPFGLKTLEGLATTSPANDTLRVELAKGFAVYAFLLQDEADRIDAVDRAKSGTLRRRARKLYLRARDYALDALEIRYPGFRATLESDLTDTLAITTSDDADALYWAGAGWAAATSLDKEDLDLVAELPVAASLVGRILEINEEFDRGAAHEFFVSYEGARPGGSTDAARRHFARALILSQGKRASVYLALAETVVVGEQAAAEFRQLLDKAMAIDPDKAPELRLANVIAQRRARWLLSRMSDLFLDFEGAPAS